MVGRWTVDIVKYRKVLECDGILMINGSESKKLGKECKASKIGGVSIKFNMKMGGFRSKLIYEKRQSFKLSLHKANFHLHRLFSSFLQLFRKTKNLLLCYQT